MKAENTKKVMTLFLAFVLCLSFCSCDSGNSSMISKNNYGNIQNGQTITGQSASVVCPTCNGSKICRQCYGEQDCFECGGSGISRCWSCLGDGECLTCSGDGGSYEYNYSSGDAEWEKCRTCYGSGKCSGCNGKGEAICSQCYGNGGYCSYCGNTGTCYTCFGTGLVTQTMPNNNQQSTNDYSHSNNQQIQGNNQQTQGNNQQPQGNSQQNQNNNQASQNNGNVSEKTSDCLIATIDGTEYQFDLITAKIRLDYTENFSYIQAYYTAKNPRGETLYKLHLTFDANLGCGTYDIIGDSFGPDLGISLSQANSDVSYHSTRANGTSAVGSFTMTERSADWRTYSGYCNATLKPTNASTTVDIDISYFNFTLN